MALDSTLEGIFGSQHYTAFTAVQIALPSGTINLLTAAGTVTFNVDGVPTTFVGSDPIFGTVAGVSSVGATMGTETPRCSIILMPPTQEAVGLLCQPDAQQSVVRCWEGAVNPATGLVVGIPHEFWKGVLDVAIEKVDDFTRTVELDTVSALFVFLRKNEGLRLNLSWQQTHWPTKTGLRFNVISTEVPVWGKEGVYGKSFGNSGHTGGNSGGTYGGGGGGGIGGGGGGGGGDVNMDIIRMLF